MSQCVTHFAPRIEVTHEVGWYCSWRIIMGGTCLAHSKVYILSNQYMISSKHKMSCLHDFTCVWLKVKQPYDEHIDLKDKIYRISSPLI